ncbi:MAPEG family protein [Ottowia sp.]|uniref:MAPEG family protein n=1 Tax=Ottowia sp. TaxID=1898956 RepID=UPI00261A2370|nr:MAPEG family protein [Ottowia sp.]
MPDPAALRIFQPVLVLALWTMLVLLLIPLARISATRRGAVGLQDFSHGESARVPPATSLPNRAFMNLLEVPVLFYVACIVAFLAGRVDGLAVALAWGYVGLRLVHGLIHLTYNRVTHRFAAFGLSNFVLLALLLRLAWQIF